METEREERWIVDNSAMLAHSQERVRAEKSHARG